MTLGRFVLLTPAKVITDHRPHYEKYMCASVLLANFYTNPVKHGWVGRSENNHPVFPRITQLLCKTGNDEVNKKTCVSGVVCICVWSAACRQAGSVACTWVSRGIRLRWNSLCDEHNFDRLLFSVCIALLAHLSHMFSVVWLKCELVCRTQLAEQWLDCQEKQKE